MQNFLCDLVSGWGVTLRKWSVQINILQPVILAALYLIGLPAVVIVIALLILVVAAIVAANLTQKTVATVDPTKVDVLPKDGP